MKSLLPHVIDFTQNGDSTLGYLSFVEDNELIPFDIKRVYWIYGISTNDTIRGNHAHKLDEQIIICMQGTVTIELINSVNVSQQFILKSATQGLYVPQMYWKNIKLEVNTILVCISSTLYSPDDYLKDFESFLKLS